MRLAEDLRYILRLSTGWLLARISWIKPRLLLCALEFYVLLVWNGAFEMDKSVRSLTRADDIHFAIVDKQTPSRVDEGIFVDIRNNTNHTATRN